MKKLLATSAITAMVGGSFVFAILMLIEDEDLGFPDLPKFVSAPLPKAGPPSTEFGAAIILEEAERITQAASLQPAVSLQPAAQLENRPIESKTEVTSPQIVPSSEYEKIVGKTAATPESSLIATPEPTLIATLEAHSITTPESTPIATLDPPAVETPEPTPIATLEPRPITTPESTPIATLDPPAVETPEPTPIATLEPRPITTPESAPIARLEPAPERPPINQTPPQIKMSVVADLLSSGSAEARQARHAVSNPEADLLVRYTKCKERGIPFKVEDKDLYFCWDENADALWNLLDRRRRKGDLGVEVKGDNVRGFSLSLGNLYCFKWPDEGGYRACVVNPSRAP